MQIGHSAYNSGGAEMSADEKPEKSDEKQSGGGLFTGRLTWWQVLLAIAVVGYLLYGKFQETKTAAQGTPATTPAKTK
jgi:hypothetical protein